MACLDTNVLIDLGNPRRTGRRKAVELIAAAIRGGEAICTTRFNVAELRVGLERSNDRAPEGRRVQRALSTLIILEFDAAAAEHFGRAQAHQLNLGRPVGDMDILIAAVCLANGQRLITRNAKHFADVQGLVVESY
jgi:predicted nucleic acid-binding protein